MSTRQHTRPGTPAILTLIALVAVVLFGGSGMAAAAGPTVVAQPTTTTLTVTPTARGYGTATVARAVVRDSGQHARPGSVRFYLDQALVATVALPISGIASVSIGTGASVGRHVVRAVYVPAPNLAVASSRADRAFDVTRARPTWYVSVPLPVVFGGKAALNVVVNGPKVSPGTASLMLGGRTIQKLAVPSSGPLKFRPSVSWNAGRANFTLTYSGNAYTAPSSRPVVLNTAKAASTLNLSAPTSLAYGTGGIVRVGITSAGTKATGVVTLFVDGTARSASRLSAGAAALTIPALKAGRHTLTAQYAGDSNHGTATRSATITAPATPCPVSARACVDLTHSVTWLQSGGRITYGPVVMTSGRPGYRSNAGMFTVYWKDINHHSSEFNNAPMPYSVFFDGGIAFHEGSVYVQSHGCIHLTQSAAQTYFNSLHVGDQVYVFGYAPY